MDAEPEQGESSFLFQKFIIHQLTGLFQRASAEDPPGWFAFSSLHVNDGRVVIIRVCIVR